MRLGGMGVRFCEIGLFLCKFFTMNTLQIEIVEPKVLSILENLESLNLIKISPNGWFRLRKNGKKAVAKKQKPEPIHLPITPAEDPDGDFMDGFGIWKDKDLPIEWSAEPNVMALAGIWKDKPMTIEKLRELAWGDRI